MNYPHLPRTVLLATDGASIPATSDPVMVPSVGGHLANQGVIVGIIADADPTSGPGQVDFDVQGTFDGETWESLDTSDETDFAAAADPATSFVYSAVLPYRMAYRVVATNSVNNDAVNFTVILLK